MSNYPSKEQVQELMEYVGSNLHLPQLVQHFDKSNIYDTNEKLVGQWIDGKPLYQKIIQGTTGSNQSWALIEDLGSTCTVIKCECYITYDQITVPSGYSAGGAIFDIALNMQGDSYKNGAISAYISATAFVNKTVYGIVQYTKTTDTALAYKLGTDEDYSTDERLVGTWGNLPLYKKTVSIGTLLNNDTKQVSTGLSNIIVRKIEGYTYNPTTGVTLNIPFAYAAGSGSSNNSISASVIENGSKIYVAVVNEDRTGFTNCYVTLYYTKNS